jgi:hypothetical protein
VGDDKGLAWSVSAAPDLGVPRAEPDGRTCHEQPKVRLL